MRRIPLCAILVWSLFRGISLAEEQGALNVSDVETEINYTDLIATYKIYGCEAVNWDYKADWKDGITSRFTRDLSTTHINDKGFRLRNAVPAQVWFSHSYQTENTNPGYQLAFYDVGQCAGYNWPDGQFRHTFTSMLKVWERVPVASVRAIPRRVKRGAQVEVEVRLKGPAPPSGTRVFLQFPKGVFAPLPEYLVVPVGQTTITPAFTLLAKARLGIHKVGAWTANAQKSKPPSARIVVIP